MFGTNILGMWVWRPQIRKPFTFITGSVIGVNAPWHNLRALGQGILPTWQSKSANPIIATGQPRLKSSAKLATTHKAASLLVATVLIL